jgi:hypothetical protein
MGPLDVMLSNPVIGDGRLHRGFVGDARPSFESAHRGQVLTACLCVALDPLDRFGYVTQPFFVSPSKGDRFPHDTVSNARTETFRRDNVDGLTDQLLYFSKKRTEVEEAAALLKFDKQVDVALLASVAARH